MEDSVYHRQLRQNLVGEIRRKGIKSAAVLDAIAAVPRHLFVPEKSAEEAYQDYPLEIGEGQTISQPYTVAYQTQLLDVKPGDRVLEIGTGSGYQAAVLHHMGAEVYSLERQKKLFDRTGRRLAQLGYGQIRLFFKDGHEGLSEYALFDKILVTAGATQVPSLLIGELRLGGTMVIPVGNAIQKMLQVVKISPCDTVIREHDDFQFVKFLAGTVA